MKNRYKIIFLFVLIFNSLRISAQTKQELLAGTWVFNYELSMANIIPEAKKSLDLMSDLNKVKFEKAYKGRKIIFRPDGSFTQEILNGPSISGLWTIENNERNIILNIVQKQIQSLEIKSLSPTSLVVTLVNSDKMRPIISDWYFTKQ